MCKRKSNSRPVAGDRVSGMRCDIKKLGPDQLLDLVLAADILRTMQICSNRNKFLEGSFSMKVSFKSPHGIKQTLVSSILFYSFYSIFCGFSSAVKFLSAIKFFMFSTQTWRLK